MVEVEIQSKRATLEAMRKQLDICKELNQSLVAQTKTVETSICEMEHRLKPITTMSETVFGSANNINSALEQIESVCSTVRAIDQTIVTLQQKNRVLVKDPTTYFDTMLKALELSRELHKAHKNRELLSNYQEFKVKGEQLWNALKGAKADSA